VDSGGNSTGQVHYIAYPSDTRTVAAAQQVLETFRSLTEIEFCETKLVDRLIACVNVASDDHCGDGLDGRADPDVYPDSDDFIRVVSGMTSSERKSALTPEVLSRRWNIGLDSAKRTLQVTTQKGVRTVLHPLTRRYRTRQSHLRFPTIRTKVYTDTMFSSVTSIRQYKCAQVFTTNTAYSRVYPLQSKQNAPDALMKWIQDVGVMSDLVYDGSKEQGGGKHWREIEQRHHIQRHVTEPHSQWQNRAEGEIREIKKSVRHRLQASRAPKRLWCFCTEWVLAVRRLTALSLPALNGRVATELLEGETPDISEYAQFDWYEPVWFIDPTSSFPEPKRKLGRWIGVASDVGQAMTFWILPKSCSPIARSSVARVDPDVSCTDELKADLAMLDLSIDNKIGNNKTAEQNKEIDSSLGNLVSGPADDLFEKVANEEFYPLEEAAEKAEADDFTPESMDEYLTAEVLLPFGGELLRGVVKARKRDADGNPLGTRNSNPILDTREYEVELPDGSTNVYSANIIAENMYSQIDDEGREFLLMQEITDHKVDGNAVTKDDGFTVLKNGERKPRMTTKGWKLSVLWKDGTSTWVPLKDLKESNPLEVAEYAVANKIAEEPAFAWWVRQALRVRDRSIKKVKSKYWKRSHKYGIELPHSVGEALRIDKETGTTFWRDGIAKEMKNVMPAFEFRDDDRMPVGHKEITCHMIFDIKAFSLQRKARLVAGGHTTDPPKDMTFASVVSRDSVRIAFLLAALNDLDILAADVQNAYLNAATKEKVWTRAGKEFGSNAGRPVVIVRALYGLKSSGARWRDHMAATLREADYTSSRADPDVWMRPATKPDGFKYWEYVLVYSDDILVVSHDPKRTMDFLESKYTLKNGTVAEPTTYLGAEVKKWRIEGSDDPTKIRWAMSSETYIKSAIADVETELAKIDKQLPSKASTPLKPGYRPELDQSPELDARRITYYQGLIGVLRWMCELGRIDILVDVAMMSRFLVIPREGQLQQLFHIFAYLKSHKRSTLVFDDTRPTFDAERFVQKDWSEFYPGAAEAIPPNLPEQRGRLVSTTCFVDADHAGCRLTRRSHTGVLIYVNRAPILWYSKRQNTVESSTYSSEFCAMRTAIDMIEGLRYKLRMLGVGLDGPTCVLCDNQSVVISSTAPETALKRKHNAINYHRTREAQAAGIVLIAKEPTETNISDFLTKSVPGPRLRELSGTVLW
jgi:hypothetical protein